MYFTWLCVFFSLSADDDELENTLTDHFDGFPSVGLNIFYSKRIYQQAQSLRVAFPSVPTYTCDMTPPPIGGGVVLWPPDP